MSHDKKCGCGEDYFKDLPLPEVTFQTFVLSLSSSAMVHLGEVPDPATGKVSEAPYLAKHSIDILGMLQKKFEEGLSEDEKKLLCNLLCDLRMKYVKKTK